MPLSRNARREAMKNRMIKKIHDNGIAFLTENFYNTIDEYERLAIINVAQTLGYNELAMNFMSNIKLVTR